MTRTGLRALLTTSALVLHFDLSAAPAVASDHDQQLWSTVAATGRVSRGTDVAAEINARYGDGVSRLSQFVVRVGIVHRVAPAIAVAGGYVYARAGRSGGATTHEHRAWQQVALILRRGGSGPALTARTRAEQRFREGRGEIAWRLRQQFRAQLPFGGGPVAAVLFQETFLAVNETGWTGPAGFEQLRAFAGLNRPLTDRIAIETGYLKQRLIRRGEDQVNHIALVNLNIRM